MQGDPRLIALFQFVAPSAPSPEIPGTSAAAVQAQPSAATTGSTTVSPVGQSTGAAAGPTSG